MNCPTDGYQQIETDLSRFQLKSINFSMVLEDAKIRWASHPGAYSFCHYIIIDNKVTPFTTADTKIEFKFCLQINRQCYGQHVGFNMFSDAILRSVTRKVSKLALYTGTNWYSVNIADSD